MSNRSRWARKERRQTWPKWKASTLAKHRRSLRAWGQPAFLMGLGKNTFIHNGGKP